MMNHLFSIIDIGSSAIRLLIIEWEKGGSWKKLESLERSIPLGQEAFTRFEFSRETINRVVEILTDYKEILSEWTIWPRDVHAIATSAVRDASNRDIFIERIENSTGIRVRIIDGIEENRLTFLAVQHALSSINHQLSRSNTLIMDVGGGSTELMLLKRNNMVAAHSLKIGTIRYDQYLKKAPGYRIHLESFLQESIQIMRTQLDSELPLGRIRNFIAVGGDTRLVARRIGKEEELFWTIDKKEFIDFVQQIHLYPVEEVFTEFAIPYQTAEMLDTALLTYKIFFEETVAEQLIVPKLSIRDGVLLSQVDSDNRRLRELFYRQVRTSAENLARKYHADLEHSEQVTRFALKIFDRIQPETGLDQDSRLLLEVAAILHDIGVFICNTGHHKHGKYIIENSEIFGLSRKDLIVVSYLVLYHRKKAPKLGDAGYHALSRRKRILILKLAAILRIADSLDRGHNQKISDVDIEWGEGEMVLHGHYAGDLIIEKASLKTKADLFENVFGMRVLLV